MILPKKALGAKGEEIAAGYLQSLGYRILERNYRVKLGEIDIIAEQGADLVFIEVKTRRDSHFGSPFEAVTAAKQQQLSRVAQEYICRRGCHNRPVRFDVVGVRLEENDAAQGRTGKVELIRNAFELGSGYR